MLCIPIIGPTLSEASNQIKAHADLLELRLDLFHEISLKDLRELRKKIERPVIFTLRKKEQGGHYRGTEEERLQHIRQLAELHPSYLDVEYDTPPPFVQEIAKVYPAIKLIVSYHDFQQTPLDLEAILKQMKALPAHFYKIACQANSTNDALRMLHFVHQNAPLLGMSMGKRGEITRILGPLAGSPWTYACASSTQKTAEGQLSSEELQSIYGFSRLTRSSGLFGLIGGTVTQSISQFTHNKLMQALNLDGVYVKMTLEQDELPSFFSLAKKIGIRGLSVTMPLKELVIPFLDYIDPDAKTIGAVNTLVFQNGRLAGYNTDGKGALDAIEAKMQVEGKKVVILGAGGAARAIIHEAIQRGGHVTVLNRTKEKALQLAHEFGIAGDGIEAILKKEYAILINTTPNPFPIPPEAIRPHTLVMDVKTMPNMNALLKEAAAKKCELVFGYEMFLNQAIAQFDLWFPSQLDKSLVRKILTEEALKHL